jgi:hypothetical protein
MSVFTSAIQMGLQSWESFFKSSCLQVISSALLRGIQGGTGNLVNPGLVVLYDRSSSLVQV